MRQTVKILCAAVLSAGLLAWSTAFAGMLDPTSPPTTGTMKTLDQIPPTWSQKLQCDTTATCPRFELVLDDAAVLDKETGLVWERNPSLGNNDFSHAVSSCRWRSTGGRLGWRLPTATELHSIYEYTIQGGARVPLGNPFSNAMGLYWSASTPLINADYGYMAQISSGGFQEGDQPKTNTYRVWCVRSPYDNGNGY